MRHMPAAAEKGRASEKVLRIQGFQQHVPPRVGRGGQKLWQLDQYIGNGWPQVHVARGPRRGRLVGHGATRRHPFGHAAVQDAQLVDGVAHQQQVPEQTGRHVSSTLVNDDDVMGRPHTPAAQPALHLRRHHIARAKRKETRRNRARNVLLAVCRSG